MHTHRCITSVLTYIHTLFKLNCISPKKHRVWIHEVAQICGCHKAAVELHRRNR